MTFVFWALAIAGALGLPASFSLVDKVVDEAVFDRTFVGLLMLSVLVLIFAFSLAIGVSGIVSK